MVGLGFRLLLSGGVTLLTNPVIHFTLYHGSLISPLPSLLLPLAAFTITLSDFSVWVCVVYMGSKNECVCTGFYIWV